MNEHVNQYEKQLRKHLTCTRKAKEKLLNHFEYMLLHFLSDNGSPTTEDLHQAFGTPAEMAQTLMVEISPEEQAQYRKGVLVRRVLAVILFVVFLVLTAYIYLFKEKPINVSDEIVPEGTQFVNPNTAEQGEE